MRGENYEYKTPPADWRRTRRAPGGGRRKAFGAEQRRAIYALLMEQRKIRRKLDELFDDAGAGPTKRARTEMLRKIWRGGGR
jgi:hypothetical protein